MERPPRNCDELSSAQCEELERRVFESLAFLRRLLTRIEQCQFPADDKLRRDVDAAYSAVMGLRMTLHYLACERMKRETPRRAWEAGGKDTYRQSREKRKG